MRLLNQIFLVVLISCLLGFVFQSLLGFYESFALFTALQIVAPFIYQALTRNRERVFSLENQINELVELNTCNVQCPCGNHTFNEILMVNEESIISKCPACNNEYRLIPSVRVVLTTEPVDLNKTFDELTIKKEQ